MDIVTDSYFWAGVVSPLVLFVLVLCLVVLFMRLRGYEPSDLVIKLVISKKAQEGIEASMDLSGNSRIGVFRKALAVYQCLWKAKARGASIIIREDNEDGELVLE